MILSKVQPGEKMMNSLFFTKLIRLHVQSWFVYIYIISLLLCNQ